MGHEINVDHLADGEESKCEPCVNGGECTDKTVIEGEEGLNHLHAPLQLTRIMRLGHMGYHLNADLNISGAIHQIFEFSSKA